MRDQVILLSIQAGVKWAVGGRASVGAKFGGRMFNMCRIWHQVPTLHPHINTAYTEFTKVDQFWAYVTILTRKWQELCDASVH